MVTGRSHPPGDMMIAGEPVVTPARLLSRPTKPTPPPSGGHTTRRCLCKSNTQIHLYSGEREFSVKPTDERGPCGTTAGWVPKPRATSALRPDPGSSGLLPRTNTELRRFGTQDITLAPPKSLRPGPQRGVRWSWRLPRLAGAPSSGWASKRSDRYGNLFEMYQRITDENRSEAPMRVTRRPTMGGALGGLQPDEHHPRLRRR
jgi:hypothetical protein